MPIFTRGDRSLLFIHIPKCAGSSVEALGAQAGWSESFSIRGKPLSQIAYCKASFQHLHAAVLEELFHLDRFDAVFTLVRHPFERFKSEYYWQRYQGITQLAVGDWVEDTLNRYSMNPYLYDNHIRPQAEFIPRHPAVRVFRVEDRGVEKAWQVFQSGLREGQGAGVELTEPGPAVQVVEEKKSPKEAATEAAFEAHYERVCRFYKADFDALGYSAERC